MIFVSVDGGATKTLAACYSDDGLIQGVGVAGSSNFRNVGIEITKENLTLAINRCLNRAGVAADEITQYSFALAGAKDSRKSTEIVEKLIFEMNMSKNVTILNDGEAGFNCRFPGKDGIVVAPGTGMIAYARRGDRFERTNGWGWFIADEGGAFYTAKEAIQESAKFFDGRKETESKLPYALLEYFNVKEPRHLENEIYTNPIDIRRIAAFTKIISNYANKEDPLAIFLLKESAKESANSIIALKKIVFPDVDPEYSGYGGVFRAGEIYWDTMKEQVESEYPNMILKKPLFGYHAVIGSIYLILKSIGKLDEFNIEIEVENLEREISKISKEEKEKYLLL